MAQTDISILVKLRDQASAGLKKLGATLNESGNQAVGFGRNLGGRVKDGITAFASSIKNAGIVAVGFLATLGILAKKILGVGINFQQTRVAFEVLLGSGEEAGKLLKEISDFARKTPFDLPQVQEGAKRLLAYNIAAEDVIPTMTVLGNLASGLGTEKLPQLILAFGQVKAATKLTGMELRQFSEAGVPLLQLLVDKANETGGVLTKVGGATKEQTKQMSSLAGKIANAEFEMDFFKKTGELTDTQMKKYNKTIDLNKAKLDKFGDVGEAVYVKVKATAADMIERISQGNVTFEEVNTVLNELAGTGGKWGDLMERQSRTVGGALQNMKDNFIRLVGAVLGFDEELNLIDGSILFRLNEILLKIVDKMDIIIPKISEFTQKLLQNETAIKAIVGGIGGLLLIALVGLIALISGAIPIILAFVAVGALMGANFDKIKEAGQRLLDKLGGKEGLIDKWNTLKETLKTMWDFVKAVFEPALELLKDSLQGLITEVKSTDINWSGLWETLKIVGGFIFGVLVIAIAGLIGILALLIMIVTKVIDWMKKLWDRLDSIESKFIRALIPVTRLYDQLKAIKDLGKITIDIIQNFVKKGDDKTNRAHGGLLSSGQASIIGERGPELFVPSATGRVVPNKDLNRVARQNQSPVSLTVNVGVYAGSESEKRNLAKELYKAMLLEAQGQGRSVEEMLSLQV